MCALWIYFTGRARQCRAVRVSTSRPARDQFVELCGDTGEAEGVTFLSAPQISGVCSFQFSPVDRAELALPRSLETPEATLLSQAAASAPVVRHAPGQAAEQLNMPAAPAAGDTGLFRSSND